VDPIVGSVSTSVGTTVAVALGRIVEPVSFGILVALGVKVPVASGVFLRTGVLIAVGRSVLTGSIVKVDFSFGVLQALNNTPNKTMIISHTIYFLIFLELVVKTAFTGSVQVIHPTICRAVFWWLNSLSTFAD
jgi:hypothetical protein